MKFVFFGYDFSLDVAKRLIKDGHTLMGVFTFPCDNTFNFNTKLIALALSYDAPVNENRPTPTDIQNFIDQGCDVFICCGYPYKIPPIDPKDAYAINTHPSLLPKARGIMPTPHIILSAPEAGGFTVHKMTEDFDAGDILFQEKITVDDTTTVNKYSDYISKRMPDVLCDVISNIEDYWQKATPQNQDEATYFPKPTEAMRTLNWDKDIEYLDRTMRAFSRFGSICSLNGMRYVIYDHDLKKEPHDFDAGTITNMTDDTMTIAVNGGFVIVTNFGLL